MDRRIVSSLMLTEKISALKEIVEYGRKNSVGINLENLSETAEDLEPVMNEVPILGLTLDVGHANLGGSENKSIAIIEKFGKLIRHVHLHDNRGGRSQTHDLHLPIGDGTVDFAAIMTSLMSAGYDGTLTLEVKPEFQESTEFVSRLWSRLPLMIDRVTTSRYAPTLLKSRSFMPLGFSQFVSLTKWV
ncbi:MAG: sugar phosphate isomerase/epimerase family protein [Desulfomonilaceae bacterium]